MVPIPFHQIDAFADRPFHGNPAAVCFLEQEHPETWMQAVAAEMNLSETAFVTPRGPHEFGLRWFTPKIEVDLCGHATLAAAHAIWSENRLPAGSQIRFATKSGDLHCTRVRSRIEMNFPATPVRQEEAAPALVNELTKAFGTPIRFIGRTTFDMLLRVPNESVLRSLQPDFRALRKFATRGLMVTSPADGAQIDFVSRFFAPAAGIDEDPVTGSAHCCLGPYWAQHFAKQKLVGYQASSRGGIVHVHCDADRVRLSGHAVTVAKGELFPR